MKKQIFKQCIAFAVMCFCHVSVNAQVYNFSSYHIYTNDDDKYLTTNVQNDSSKVFINEENREIKLSLYNSEAKKWMTFVMNVNYKLDIGFKKKIGVLYMCTNNANKTCGVCIMNTNEGVFIDLHDFFVSDRSISCWAKEK